MVEVSVIMSVYNEKIEWLENSIDSILNQTFKKFEFIIINDNPKNEEIKLYLNNKALTDKRIILIENSENIGLIKSLNKAIDISKGYYIARMDADDVSLPNRLQLQKDILEKKNNDFIYSNVNLIDENNDLISKGTEKFLNNEELKKIVRYGNPSKHPTWFLKKSLYIDLKGYRQIPHSEDYDFFLRALLNGYKIEQISTIVLNYRYRNTSISRTNGLYQFKITLLLKKLFKTNEINNDKKVECEVEKILNMYNGKQLMKYSKYIMMRDSGIELIKQNKKFKGISLVLKSCLRDINVLNNTFKILVYRTKK